MEKILYLRNNLNLINIDSIWCLYKIKEMKNMNKNIIIDVENINKDIIHVYNIIDNLIITYSINDVYINYIIIMINDIIKKIEIKIKNIKDEIVNNNKKQNEDIDKITKYMDFVIENGYIDFDKYKENILFKEIK